jgi:Domain of unknown function (DUF5615)
VALLFADENFPGPVVHELRELGHDVLTIQEIGRASEAVPDDEVLQTAITTGRAVLTLNRRHFKQLHNKSASHAGMILCQADNDFLCLAARIHLAILSAGDLGGLVIRVNRPG